MCHVCGVQKNVGDVVVAIKNNNKSGRNSWDHVCEGECASRYKPPSLASKSSSSTASAVKAALSATLRKVAQKVGVVDDSDDGFLKRAEQLDFAPATALEVLEEHGGDRAAALKTVSDMLVQDFEHDLDAEEEVAPPAQACSPCKDDSESDALPTLPPPRPSFSSVEARMAVHDVFMTFVKPILPKSQTDGSYRHGDPELLDVLMPTPVTLALPRAERLADLVRPSDGWDERNLARARSFFALSGAGVHWGPRMHQSRQRRCPGHLRSVRSGRNGSTKGGS